ncbi:MAG: sugar ABC transporter permease [Spirochaetae bacterium HGW-Spirochaetae-8]|jgi:raffinose/stachyose/melibiose transport system permease protein|nr:MAG: sugar ABC transporter permease [Spirochaetae bacterium HGW-Spirochaetae-8]
MASTNRDLAKHKFGIKTVFGFALCFIYLLPFVLVLVNSLKRKVSIVKFPLQLIDDNGLQLVNYSNAIEKMDFFRSFANSIFITVFSVLILVLFSSMAAYFLVRHSTWKVCKLTFSLMLASMAVPFQVVMIPLITIYGGTLHVLNSRTTLILMNFGFGIAMCTFMCHGFIKSSVPIAVEEAATIDGCSAHGIFFRIVFPLLKPILSTIVILESMGFWNDFLLPSLVLGKRNLYTLPLAIRTFYGTFSNDYGNIMAGLVLSMLPIIVLYILMQRNIISGVVAGAVKY